MSRPSWLRSRVVERRRQAQRRLLVERRIEDPLPAQLGEHAIDQHLAVGAGRLLRDVEVEAGALHLVGAEELLDAAIGDACLGFHLDRARRQVGQQRQADLELGVDLALDALARQPDLLEDRQRRAFQELDHRAERRLRSEHDLADRDIAHDFDGGEDAPPCSGTLPVRREQDSRLGDVHLEPVVLDARRRARRGHRRQIVDDLHLEVGGVHEKRQLMLLRADARLLGHVLAAQEAKLAAEDRGAVHALAHPFARAGRDGLRPQRLQRVERHRAERAFEPRARGLHAGDEIASQRDLGAARAQLELGELDLAAVRQDAAVGVPLIERHRRNLEFLRPERAFGRAELIGPRRMLGLALLLLRRRRKS